MLQTIRNYDLESAISIIQVLVRKGLVLVKIARYLKSVTLRPCIC